MTAHVTYSVTACKRVCDFFGHNAVMPGRAKVAAMVTDRIRKHVKPRLFLKEHREAKGISAEVMGGRLGIERESVYRLEREQHRLNSEKQAQYAAALDVEPQDLWHLPGVKGRQSLDSIVRDASPEVHELAVDIVRRLVNSR